MSSEPIAFLPSHGRPRFPRPAHAMATPNGLLAAGGKLTPDWLMAAYTRGIFPWYSEGEPILWWSPDPRCVFRTDGVHVSRRWRRQLRQSRWSVHADQDFAAVIKACAAPRADSPGTWLLPPMREAYCELHRRGHAHSIEVRDGDQLVGGLYGIACGRMFCGESMFSTRSGGSKLALLALGRVLADWGWPLLDAQVPNPHLLRMGAIMLPRQRYLDRLTALQQAAPKPGSWRERWPNPTATELASA